MDKPLFSASADMKREYCAKIVRIGALHPIPGADRLMQTFLDGNSIVVEKDMFHSGEVVVYCQNETQINRNFLAANNQFDIGNHRLNANRAEVDTLLAQGAAEEAQRRVGKFGRQGRVKLIRLRGCPSYGCIFRVEQLAQWNPKLASVNLEDYLVTDDDGHEHTFNFDTVDGNTFVQAYIPRVPTRPHKNESRHNRRLHRFDRLEPGQFLYHYETDTLNGNVWRLKPDTSVTISLKMHGTSACLGNLLTRQPSPLSAAARRHNRSILRRIDALNCRHPSFPWQRCLVQKQLETLRQAIIQPYRLAYGPVWSSRGVIKNRYINPGVTEGFYEVDLWSEYGQLLQPYIAQGLTVYGEICGYLTGRDRMIMKNYDYGCAPGTNFFMPYRITHTSPDGRKQEWSVREVQAWTRQLMHDHPQIAPRLRPIYILYHGTMRDLYPQLDVSHFWHDNLLEALKTDATHFGMEQDEPLCRHQVPREGICLRIDGDPVPQCFKLKTTAFFQRETKLIDQGLVDYEMEAQQHITQTP